MVMTNLLPGQGVWQLRLHRSSEQLGHYSLSLHDPKAWTQGGPFFLRFPTDQYALSWFKKFILPDSLQAKNDKSALEKLAKGSFLEAEGNSSVWAPIVTALFHSAPTKGFLVSAWWYGSVTPWTSIDPLAPIGQEPTDLGNNPNPGSLDLFLDLNTSELKGIRKQILDDDNRIDFIFWKDNGFSSNPPEGLESNREFHMISADSTYLDLLTPLLREGTVVPTWASSILYANPSALLSPDDLPVEFVPFMKSELQRLAIQSLLSDAFAGALNLNMWINRGGALSAYDVTKHLLACLQAAHRDKQIMEASRNPNDQSIEVEEDSFCEVLFGPEAESIFAFHTVSASRNKGDRAWHVHDHEWRTNGDWDDDFPEYSDDWRWLAENERLESIPDIAAEIQKERDQDEELMIAWDVSDSYRLQDCYVDEFTKLFDLHLDIPVGLGKWMETHPEEMCDPNLLANDQDDPRFQAAAKTLSRVLNQVTTWPPDTLIKPLSGFVINKRPMTAREITETLISLLAWFHEIENPKINSPRINPQDIIGNEKLINFVSALITLTDDVVVINVESKRYPDGVYVQLCREDDGALTLEAVSSKFLESPLSPDELSTLATLGWDEPRDEDMPNFSIFLEPEQTTPVVVAKLLVDTLQKVYGTSPTDLHQFAPDQLVRSLLNGDHGQQYAVNPALSQAQKGRLYLGLSFPHDLNPEGGNT